MPLEVARQRIANALEGWLYNRIPAQGRLLADMVYEWYDELKKFEAEENFPRAFGDNRMTMRLLNAEVSRSANDYQRQVKSHKVVKQPDGAFKKIGETTDAYLSGGLKGMRDRMIPANFERPGPGLTGVRPQSRKNVLGLHDLSGRLLDRRFPIGQQGFELDKTKHAIFMPVPPEEDHALLYNLNLSAKGDLSHVTDFVEALAFVRARLTRIKLAEPTDMGSSLVVWEDILGRTRIRYGYTGKVTAEKKVVVTEKTLAEQLQERREKLHHITPENIKNLPEDVPLTAEQIRTRIRTGLQYKCVLRTTMELGTNELTIAYREYQNDKFPLVTDWPDKGSTPGNYQIQSGPFVGRYLYDDGTIH